MFRSLKGFKALSRQFTKNRVQSITGLPQIPVDTEGYEVDLNQPHQSSKLTHLSNAEEMIWKVPVVEVSDNIVRCTGTSKYGYGHPIVYI